MVDVTSSQMAKKNFIGMCAHGENEDCGGKHDDTGKPGQCEAQQRGCCRLCIVLEISWSLKLFQNENFFCFFLHVSVMCVHVYGDTHVCRYRCTPKPEVPTSSLLIAFHFIPEAGSLV